MLIHILIHIILILCYVMATLRDLLSEILIVLFYFGIICSLLCTAKIKSKIINLPLYPLLMFLTWSNLRRSRYFSDRLKKVFTCSFYQVETRRAASTVGHAGFEVQAVLDLGCFDLQRFKFTLVRGSVRCLQQIECTQSYPPAKVFKR